MQGRPQKRKIKSVIVSVDDIIQIYDFTSKNNFVESQKHNSINKNIVVEKIRNKSILSSSEEQHISKNQMQEQHISKNTNMMIHNNKQIEVALNKSLNTNKNLAQSPDGKLYKINEDIQYFNNDEIDIINNEFEDDNFFDLCFSD